jgi:Ca-activated chloride channel family protein
MSFNILWAAWFFFLIIPLVAFYFLKLRRNRLEISSLLLWQQVLQDSRVNSPFQRFKRNILLLLQLLLLCLLIFAAMDPFILGRSSGIKLPVMVDCSASMGALDESGKTRLDIVKEKLTKLINNKKDEQELAIISFDKTAQRRCSFTSNKQILLETVERLEVKDVEGEIEEALKVTQAMTKSSQFGEVLLYTDGNIKNVPSFNLPFKLNYQQVGRQQSANIGITQLSARRSGTSSWIVFVQLDCTLGYSESSTVQIFQNDKKIGEERVLPGENSRERISFRVDGSKPSLIKVVLKPSGKDSLSSDNSAFLNLKLARPLSVYVSENHDLILKILESISGLQIVSKDAPIIDLVITDKKEDMDIPCICLLSFGFIPDDLEGIFTENSEQSKIIDWERSDLLLQHVSFSDILLLKTLMYKKGFTKSALEKKSYQLISFGEKAPIAVKKDVGDSQRYHFLFHYQYSTLPYKVAFPILLTNVVNKALADAGLSEKSGNRTGMLPEYTLKAETEYEIVKPDGNETLKSNENGLLNGISALMSGNYKINLAGKTVKESSVSLLSPAETRLATLDSVKFNEVSVEISEEEAVTDKPLWTLIAAIAFGLLLIEWWLYQKRPGRARVT